MPIRSRRSALAAAFVAVTVACGALSYRAGAAGPGMQPTRAARKSPKLARATPAPDTFTFRAIGPVVSGGRVSAVAGSDRDDRLYFVGGAAGGVFKSIDGGTSFQPAWSGPHFGALGNPWKNSNARGVYRTVDGGRSWTKTLFVGPASGVADLAWNPRAPRTVFALSAQSRARLIALRNALTSNALHDEDSVGLPDRVREQIGGLIGQIGGAVQPPFEQHQAALDALRPVIVRADAQVRAVLGDAFAQRLEMSAPNTPAPSAAPARASAPPSAAPARVP
jgi:hypothetical protein